jgi:Ca2+-transporting ATPase
MILFIIGTTVSISAALLYLPPVTRFFEFEQMNFVQLGVSIIVGAVSVLWYEIVKLRARLLALKK